MHSTLIRNVDRRPEDSGQWPRAPRPYRPLPRTDRPGATPNSVAPVAMAWLLVLTAYAVPFGLVDDESLPVAVILVSLLAPAFGTLWIAQFRRANSKETTLRAVLWSAAAMVLFAILTKHVFIAIAMAPYYMGSGILAALLTNYLVTPKHGRHEHT